MAIPSQAALTEEVYVMAAIRDEIPPGTLDMLILRTLHSATELHGFEIASAIQQRSEDVLRVDEGRCREGLPRRTRDAGEDHVPDTARQWPREVLRVYHCCWKQGLTTYVIRLSPMKLPLAYSQYVSVSSKDPLICTLRKGAPSETPHCRIFGAAFCALFWTGGLKGTA